MSELSVDKIEGSVGVAPHYHQTTHCMIWVKYKNFLVACVFVSSFGYICNFVVLIVKKRTLNKPVVITHNGTRYRRNSELDSIYGVILKKRLQQGPFEPRLCDNLVYKFKMNFRNFSQQFKKIDLKYRKTGYNIDKRHRQLGQDNLVRIDSLVHKILCRQESVTRTPTPTLTPTWAAPKSTYVVGHKYTIRNPFSSHQ